MEQTPLNILSTEVKIGDWLKEAINLYSQNFPLLFLSVLLTVLVSGLSLGVLAGAMCAAVFLLCLRLYDQGSSPSPTRPQVVDVFKGFDFFLNALFLALIILLCNWLAQTILGMFPLIGSLLATLAPFVLGTCFIFSFPLLVERRFDLISAISSSFEIIKRNPSGFVIYNLVICLIAGSGALLFGVGVFLTLPLMFCAVVVAYRKVVG